MPADVVNVMIARIAVRVSRVKNLQSPVREQSGSAQFIKFKASIQVAAPVRGQYDEERHQADP
jgi:hypothetical protein